MEEEVTNLLDEADSKIKALFNWFLKVEQQSKW